MNEQIKTTLSVIDTERKFAIDYEEATYGGGIVSYGPNNDAPALFRNCYRNSATLKSIIDGNVNYILGDEIEIGDDLALFKEQVNRRGMTMRQFIANLALSIETYGGLAIQVIYTKLGTVAELYPLDFGRCRTNEDGTKIFYSSKPWSKYQTKAVEYDRFDPRNFKVEKPTQIYYYKGDFTSNVYPLPPFYGAIKDILTEIECANYSLNSVANGFAAKYVFNFPDVGNLTNEQKRGIERSIKEKFCGSDAQSNFLLYWKDGNADGLDIKKVESDDSPERFIAIKDNARTNIFTAMRATPNLFGLPTATTGFNGQEYGAAYKLYQKSVIAPIQDIILECISKVTGTKGAIIIKPYMINFE